MTDQIAGLENAGPNNFVIATKIFLIDYSLFHAHFSKKIVKIR